MDHLRALPTPPDALLVTGDIADGGAPAQYRELRDLLATDFPVLVCPGTLVPQFVDPARPMAGQVLTLAAAQPAVVALWLFGWSFPVACAARRSGSAAARRFWARVSGAVLIGLGLRSAVA